MDQNQQVLKHIAIIMDGNRRWATEKGIPKFLGHTEGAKNIKKIATATQNAGIPFLTLYTLSTENLKNRSEDELKHLFSLMEQLPDYLGDFQKNNTRLNLIGDIDGLPKKTKNKLLALQSETSAHTSFTLTLAINYGGRDELTRAVKKIVAERIADSEITEEIIQSHLDTADMPDVDLVIRTGGDQRLSGYLPWQSVYAELYFTSTYWPAFTDTSLTEAIEWFYTQKRNKGK
jgi:undecaprenyl diphosphate synthase